MLTLVDLILIIIFFVAIQYIVQYFQHKPNYEKLLNYIKTLQDIIKCKEAKEETFYKILKHIKQQLKLINLNSCPEEERTNIPNEVCDWIDELLEDHNASL